MNQQDRSEPPDQAGDRRHSAVIVNDQPIELGDHTPTGEQILSAARLRPAADYALLRWPDSGPTNEVALDDTIKLPRSGPLLAFFAIKSDRVSYFTLDEERYAWAGPLDADTVRRIGRVDPAMELWLELSDQKDRLVQPGEVIDLDMPGVERLYTKRAVWHLRVNDEDTEWPQSRVLVRDALTAAGFNVSRPWTMKFKVQGQPVRAVNLDDELDLSQAGVERLRVAPSEVNNGDGQDARREFSLLAADAEFLDRRGLQWQAVNNDGQWLIVSEFPLPLGYNAAVCTLAVLIPPSYPTAALDMFFCHPPLSINGRIPPQTEHHQAIDGRNFQRWSRHRGGASQWSPGVDNLASHFALIDEALAREVGA
ncbi:multiubiquitin domain-containing protein [Stenotrophomonas sp. TD3]|uniref:multiubiquitin domain-containing protein n=1 Tax=Stenotrophomonas sp. TD3 TaxID=1641707 RepID=UPI000952B32F|nr:multiubiquitin domain-containing protein [Stenotrophomonas sp. TD3]